MAYLLDSNVVSELWKPEPAVGVLSWLREAEGFVPVKRVRRRSVL
jgi:predicted nucleic acid-binding protein